MAKKLPIAKQQIGAIHQKRGCANTVLTPAHCARRPDVPDGRSVSGTEDQMASAAAKVAIAQPMKSMRQVVWRSAISSGAVAASAPKPPATITQPPSDARLSKGYQVA